MFKDGVIYLGLKVVSGFLAILSIFIFTRLLSEHQYGIYSLGVSLISFISVITFQWVNISVARLYAEKGDFVLTEAIYWYFKVSLLIVIGGVIAFALREKINTNGIFIFSVVLGVISSYLFSLHQQIANVQGRAISYGLLAVYRLLILLVGGVTLLTIGYDKNLLLFMLPVSAFFAVVIVGIYKPKRSRDKVLSREIFTYGMVFSLLSTATIIIDMSDRFLISVIIDPAQVAVYSSAYDLNQQLVGAVLSVFSLLFYPRIMSAWESNNLDLTKYLVSNFTNSFILAMMFVVGILIVLSEEILLLLDEKLRFDAAIIAPWVIFGIAVGCFKGYVLDIHFHINKRAKVQVKIIFLMAGLNILLNLFMIPKLGILGAAISTFLTFSIGSFVSWLNVRNTETYVSPVLEIIKGLLSILVMMLFVELMGFLIKFTYDILDIACKFFFSSLAFFITALFLKMKSTTQLLNFCLK